MLYFYDDTYTFENLKDEDKHVLVGYDFVVENVNKNIELVKEYIGIEKDGKILDKLKEEIVDEAFEYLLDFLDSDRQQLIVEIIDGYEAEVEPPEVPEEEPESKEEPKEENDFLDLLGEDFELEEEEKEWVKNGESYVCPECGTPVNWVVEDGKWKHGNYCGKCGTKLK